MTTLLLAVLSFIGCENKDSSPAPVAETPVNQSMQPQTDLSQVCERVEQRMKEMNAQRTTLALEQINKDISICLPNLETLSEKLALLELSNQMYRNFLKVERTPEEQKHFEQYALERSQHPTIQESHLKQLSLRDQYLLKHQGQAYIDLYDDEQHRLTYRRHPSYLDVVFAPYLPAAEATFISLLAEQNRNPIFNSHGLSLSATELVNRTLAWEKYLKQYPNSTFKQDAKTLYQQYQVYLFKGSQHDADASLTHPKIETREALETLIQESNSNLSHKAQAYLKLIQNEDTNHQFDIETELNQILGFDTGKIPNRNCLIDAICLKGKPFT